MRTRVLSCVSGHLSVYIVSCVSSSKCVLWKSSLNRLIMLRNPLLFAALLCSYEFLRLAHNLTQGTQRILINGYCVLYVLQTYSCLYGSPYPFLLDNYLILVNNKHKLIGKSHEMGHNNKNTIIFFSANFLIDRLLYVGHKTGKRSEVAMYIEEISHVVDFLPHSCWHFNSSACFLH